MTLVNFTWQSHPQYSRITLEDWGITVHELLIHFKPKKRNKAHAHAYRNVVTVSSITICTVGQTVVIRHFRFWIHKIVG